MNHDEEILNLKRQVAQLQAEIDGLKAATRRANVMVDVIKQGTVDLAIEVNHAHEKINSLLYQNPAIVEDIVDLEKILGPADRPTPNAPPNS